jgi:hypothetical protein
MDASFEDFSNDFAIDRVWQRLDVLRDTAPIIHWSKDSRAVVFSDQHRCYGNTDSVDQFYKNWEVSHATEAEYRGNGYKIIYNGDIEDLWMCDDLKKIQAFYGRPIFDYRLSGNHDRELGYPEALILEADPPILIHHGYGGDPLNDEGWKQSRWLLRHIGRQMEEAGIIHPASVSQNTGRHALISQALQGWAEDREHRLISGHTHTALEAPPWYWNEGCEIRPEGITGVVVEGDEIRGSIISSASNKGSMQRSKE